MTNAPGVDYAAMQRLDAFAELELPFGVHITTPRLYWIDFARFDGQAENQFFKNDFQQSYDLSGETEKRRFVRMIHLCNENHSREDTRFATEVVDRELSFEEICSEINLLLDKALSSEELDSL